MHAERCRQVLEALGVGVTSAQQIVAGASRSDSMLQAIESAQGVVVLLNSAWSAKTAALELQPIIARCQQGGHLFIVKIEEEVLPSLFQSLAAERVCMFPRAGKSLSGLPRPKQDEVWALFRRSVARRFGLPPPQDAQHQQLKKYREAQIRQLETVPFKGFSTAQHPSVARTVAFDELFVPPRLGLLQRTAEVERELRQLDAELDDQSLTPARRFAIESRRPAILAEHAERKIYGLAEALTAFPKLMLLGKPGSGKSSILQHLALQAHRSGLQFAVLIKLHEVSETALRSGGLWGYILRTAPEVDEAFEEWADEGRGLLLLDGVDEVRTEYRPQLLQSVRTLLLTRPQLRCVVTARVAAGCWLDSRISHLIIAELSSREISAFVMQHKRSENRATAEQESASLLKSITARRELDSLATNPLSLRLLCLLDRHAPGLLLRLIDLYERALFMLLETWPANRVSRRIKVSPTELRRALGTVACWMHDLGMRAAPQADLLKQLEAALHEIKPRASTAQQLAQCCLDAATLHAGILTETSSERFEFLHLTFIEYLAAERAVQSNALPALRDRRPDGRYEQVIRFAAGQLAEVQKDPVAAATFIRSLCDEVPGSLDQLRHPYLPLAASCIGDGTKLSPPFVSELLCAVLRAATIPLQTLVDAAERSLGALAGDPGAAVIEACAVLIHHPLDSLVDAAVRFLARHTVTQPRALSLCLEMLSNDNSAIACHGALGLIRAGVVPDAQLRPLTWHLSFSFRPTIMAEDEVERALRMYPELARMAQALYDEKDHRWQHLPARLLSLLRPEDWEILSVLLSDRSEESARAVTRAALRREEIAESIVDLYLEEARPPNHLPRPSSEEAVHSIFAESAAARRRFLFHFKRRVPAKPLLGMDESPDVPAARAAAAFLERLASQSDERQAANRKALFSDLQQVLATADVELTQRIAALGAAGHMRPSWLAFALECCMSAGGAIRVWAIDRAYECELHALAISGTLVRAATQGCMAASVIDFRGRLQSRSESLLDALALQPKGALRDALLLLGNANVRGSQHEPVVAMLSEPLGTVPLPLCYWAAIEVFAFIRRGKVQITDELLGPLLALASVKWGDALELQDEIQDRPLRRLRNAEIADSLEFISLSEYLAAHPLARSQSVATIRSCWRWLRKLVSEGASINRFIPSAIAGQLHEATAADSSLLGEIIEEMTHVDPTRCEVAKWLLRCFCIDSRPKLSKSPAQAPQAAVTRAFLNEQLMQQLWKAAPGVRWQLCQFLHSHMFRDQELDRALASFLESQYALPVRWRALLCLHRSKAALAAEALAVLDAALAGEDLALRLDAVEHALMWKLAGPLCESALRPLLGIDVEPVLRLHAAALWLRIPNLEPAAASSVLTDLLQHIELGLPDGRHVHFVAALDHLCGSTPHGQIASDRRFEPSLSRASVGLWSAALLLAIGGHEAALWRAVNSWCETLISDDSESKSRQEWYFEVLSIIKRIGVGEAGAAIDRILIEILKWERHRLNLSLHWMQELQRLSRPLLEQLVPIMVSGAMEAEKVHDWVVEAARQDVSIRSELASVLTARLRQPQLARSGSPWKLLSLIREFSTLDADTAALFVDEAANEFPEHVREKGIDKIVEEPVIHEHLLAAIKSREPYTCIRLSDWLLPIASLTNEDGSPLASPPAAVIDLLRSWLTHPDYGMRIEGGERLYLLGDRDETVLHSLRSCLYAPLSWSGSYSGDSVRKTAARLLIRLGVATAQELSDSLIPIIDDATSYPDALFAVEDLSGVKQCHEPTLAAVSRVLPRLRGSPGEYWRLLRKMIQLGLSDAEQIPLFLKLFAIGGSSQSDAVQAFRLLIDGKTTQSRTTASKSSRRMAVQEPDEDNERSPSLWGGPLRGAALLSGLRDWPEVLLLNLAFAIDCDLEILRKIESSGHVLEQAVLVTMLEPIVHHLATDDAIARLVRHACLLRFGPAVGIDAGQLAYRLVSIP